MEEAALHDREQRPVGADGGEAELHERRVVPGHFFAQISPQQDQPVGGVKALHAQRHQPVPHPLEGAGRALPPAVEGIEPEPGDQGMGALAAGAAEAGGGAFRNRPAAMGAGGRAAGPAGNRDGGNR